ncbi:biopolymer transporter Tol [Aestuariimicrobium soli]|uniref:TolB family protein n=1 Tax=Aestuariimicrobium soli TaxID=2035834 RepID=UPI003EB80137
MPARHLLPGQRAEIWTLNVETGERRLRWSSSDLLVEAPNWTADNRLLVNGDGRLFTLSADGDDAPVHLPTPGLDDLNNDHVLDPDGEHVFVSDSGTRQIHRVNLASGEQVRVTGDDEGLFHFLHGVSPDGAEIAWVGLSLIGDWAQGQVRTNLYCSATTPPDDPAVSSGRRQLTDDDHPDDGPEFSPDGEWLWFNSERRVGDQAEPVAPGHAQIFRMPATGGHPTQLTFDERVNWFPHVSPSGCSVVYVSFPPGTLGHPENKDVILRELLFDGGYRDLVALHGGQGTINVNSWSPDSTRIAYVAYPLD